MIAVPVQEMIFVSAVIVAKLFDDVHNVVFF